jgi:hypothetical protein
MANVQMNRTSRAEETREKEVRPVSWRPASDLPIPNPQDGYTFHWKRASMMGEADHRNMAAARREGWEPCKATDHPEFANDLVAFGLEPTGLIEIGGLVLCKTTVENAAARKQYYENNAQSNMQSVDNNFLRESDPRMPLFSEKSSKVSFGRGS